MKTKITLSLILSFFISGMFSQVNNWDSVTYNGFGLGKRAYQIQEFNNALYVGTTQQTPGVPIDVYTSTSGDTNTWTPTTFSITASVFETQLNCFYVDNSTGGKLYTGTSNSEDGGSIYSFDGSVWTNISGVVPPWDSSYADVSTLLVTSQDTLFAFLVNYSGYNTEIWKTHKTNISWTMVNELPTGSSVVSVASIYNDTIFFALTNYNTGNSFVYKTTNGTDTVKSHANPGLTNSANEFVAFGTHNNFLYAGTGNYGTGASLYKYASDSGWIVVDTTGLGYGYNLYNINSIYSFRHKLWLSGTGQDGMFIQDGARMMSGPNHTMGGPITAEIFVSSDGTNFRQCAPSGFRDYYFYGDYCRLASMGDYMYAAGTNDNGPGGEVWRSSVPLVGFTTEFDTTCAFMQENYYGTPVNAPYVQWYVNSTSLSGLDTTNYIYPAAGSYTIALVAYSADSLYTDSMVITKVVTASLDATQLSSFNVCENASINLGDAFSISGGTTPYIYSWTNGTDTYTAANPSVIAANNATYTLTLNDAHMCVATRTVGVNVTNSTNLLGFVTDASPAIIDNGIVYVFQYHPGGAGYDTVGYVNLQSGAGEYLFPTLDAGDYLIKVLPDEATYPLAVPTYYGNTFQWDSSLVYTHGCAQNDTVNIVIVETDGTTGIASVSGYIIEGGPGFGEKYGNFGNDPIIPFAPGGPLKGIDVKLGKNPSGGVQARTSSDTTGFYQFLNVPAGSYKIYVDIPNLPMDSTRLVNIAQTDSSIQNNYYVDSTHIYIDTTGYTGLASNKTYDNKFVVYPNPAKGSFTLSYDLFKAAGVSFEIRNSLGEIIYTEQKRNYPEGKNIFMINTEQIHIKGGVYFVSLLSEGKTYTQRLVIID